MPRQAYATRLFIDGHQIGDNATFMESFDSDQEAIDDARAFGLQRGTVESIELASLPRWEGCENTPTIVLRITTGGD